MEQYFMPVKVIEAEDCVHTNAAVFASFGKKAMLVTGRNSAKICGALNDVLWVLEQNGQDVIVFDQVMNNPTIACVYEGAQMAKENQVDFIVGIGGGSPMDAAKAIAMLACNDLAPEDIFSGNYPGGALPMIHIPTTAGTGSEVTQYAILTNDAKETKTSVSSPVLFPRVALLDEKYLEKLPYQSMVYTVIDALSHSIEGMLTKKAGVLSDTLAHDAIRLFAKHVQALKAGKFTAEVRRELLKASALAGMVIANTGTCVVHTMGYSLTYFKNIDHGCANGLLLGAFMEYAYEQMPGRIGEILDCLGMEKPEDFTALMAELLKEKPVLTEAEVKYYTEQAASSPKLAAGLVAVDASSIEAMIRASTNVII